MPKEYLTAKFEYQYIHYDYGGKFEIHRDTICDPYNCELISKDHIPRLLTFIIYLNPDWEPDHGGTFEIIEYRNLWSRFYLSWLIGEYSRTSIPPTLGTSLLFRADKLHHEASFVNKTKRAISIFINIKKVDQD